MFLPLVVLACACSDAGGGRTVASLKLASCAVVGDAVAFDASGSTSPGGHIVRYVFTIGHGSAPLVSKEPKLEYVFRKPAFLNGKIAQYQVLVTVYDEHGGQAYAADNIFVVYNEGQCPEPIPEPDIVLDDVVEEPFEIEEWASDVPEEIPEPACPIDLARDYQMVVFCQGSISGSFDISLDSADCLFWDADPTGLLTVELDDDGFATLKSPYKEMYIEQCTGQIEDPADFTLDCNSGCTAVFTGM